MYLGASAILHITYAWDANIGVHKLIKSRACHVIFRGLSKYSCANLDDAVFIDPNTGSLHVIKEHQIPRAATETPVLIQCTYCDYENLHNVNTGPRPRGMTKCT